MCSNAFSIVTSYPLLYVTVPGMAIFGYQLSDNYCTRGPRGGNVANAFMAAPPGHPFISFAISQLRATAHRDLLHATGPCF